MNKDKKPVSIRLDQSDQEALDLAQTISGLNKTQIIRIALQTLSLKTLITYV